MGSPVNWSGIWVNKLQNHEELLEFFHSDNLYFIFINNKFAIFYRYSENELLKSRELCIL